jgi:hypothetical protein
MTRARGRIFLLFALVAPFGWFMFWAVFHRAPGQDWVVFPTAAALVRAHDFATLADPRAFTDVLNRTHTAWFAKPISQLHPWVYPPPALLLALAFGWMPYLVSLLAFLGLTGAAMVAALWHWEHDIRRRLLLIGFVLLCPATAYQIGAGQLSFLVAAILLAAMALLEGRPFWAGALLGLLCLKPQLGLMIPVALLAARQFRAIAGAAASAGALAVLSLALLGLAPWHDWILFASGASPWFVPLLQQMRVYDQSMHATLHMLGASDAVAGIGQMLATLGAAICVWLVFARAGARRRRLIVLLCAMIVAAPHVSGYDHVLLAIACLLVLLADRPLRREEVALAASAWIATVLNPPALIAVMGLPALTFVSALTGVLPAMLLVTETCFAFPIETVKYNPR